MTTTDFSTMRLWAVRGAVNLDIPSEELLQERVQEMLLQLIEKNSLTSDRCISVQFTQTGDITFGNAAKAARDGSAGDFASSVPLFVSREPDVDGSLPLTVRVLITFYGDLSQAPVHVYLYDTAVFRRDLDGGAR